MLLQLKTNPLELLSYESLTEEIQLEIHWVSAEGKTDMQTYRSLVE